MRNHRTSLFLLLISAGIIGGLSPNSYAQNFANWKPHQAKDDKGTTVSTAPKMPEIPEPAEQVSATPAKELSVDEIVEKTKTLADASKYTLGANDVLQVSVQRHPEVTGEYAVNSEGKIQYEFVGDIKVLGLTKDQVSKIITEKLSKYIVSPDVTIKISGYNSKIVFVIGEVGQPGKIFMRGDTITVREALLQAGLPLLSASTRKCRLITPDKSGKAKQIFVNVEALLYEGNLTENLVMKPGDTLYIPATIMAKAMRVIAPVAQPIGTAAGTTRTVYPGF